MFGAGKVSLYSADSAGESAQLVILLYINRVTCDGLTVCHFQTPMTDVNIVNRTLISLGNIFSCLNLLITLYFLSK